MVARPGRMQSAMTAGEIDPSLYERWELKYFNAGARFMENVVVVPQGGFKLRDGLRDIGSLAATAARLFPFNASDGSAYDLVFSDELATVWGASASLDSVATNATTAMLPQLTVAQELDTMILFHNDLEPQRIKILAPTNWTIDTAPFEAVPTYDYGEAYVNGVAAQWRLTFYGMATGTVFELNVSGQTTEGVVVTASASDNTDAVLAAILKLPNVRPGVTATLDGDTILIEFAGEGNEGDGWAISVTVKNKADGAVLCNKEVTGVKPGEPLMSEDRGWPACGAFFNQRLLIGGFKSLPNAWMFSKLGEYYNYDERFTDANGPALVPMDVPGGERIERIVPSRNLAIFTTKAEYWLAERTLSKTSAPNHVQSSTHGVRPGVPIVENEGALLFIHSRGNVLGEFRYTDVEGNFASTDISLLAPHLVREVKDQAVRQADGSTSGNLLGLIQDDGQARLASILREQEVTALTRMMSASDAPLAVTVNGRNEMGWIFARESGRRLERFEAGLLLDSAVSTELVSPSATITGLSRFNGQDVWAIADGNVFGPFTVSGGSLTLPVPATLVTVGLWSPPIVRTLPLPRTIGPNTVLKRRARIHSVIVSVLDTTSIAIGVNGKPARDIDLQRYGLAADTPELDAPYSGDVKLRGFTGYRDDPYVEITQVRPGRLTVRSITVEAAL